MTDALGGLRPHSGTHKRHPLDEAVYVRHSLGRSRGWLQNATSFTYIHRSEADAGVAVPAADEKIQVFTDDFGRVAERFYCDNHVYSANGQRVASSTAIIVAPANIKPVRKRRHACRGGW